MSEFKLLTVKETAELFGMSERTLYNQICPKAKQQFPIKPKRIGKLVRFDSRDIEKFLTEA